MSKYYEVRFYTKKGGEKSWIINARIDELVDLKNATLKAIQILPDFDQQNVLIARYIDGKKWLDIAFDLNFSISQVYKIHGKALISFSEKNPNLLLSLEQ